MKRNKNGDVDRLCGNWIAHMSFLEAIRAHKISIQCPECGKTHEFLGWTCCDLSIEDASRKLGEEYRRRVLAGRSDGSLQP
ncbi:MAG TPA: hypothetical protein VMS81_00135 [Methanomicrobiales archaeon]|jgi:hypothetical protein|nr:hypothetical protein [Methanomicrobiales archaeon]